MGLHLGVNVLHDVGFAVVDNNGAPLVIYEETKFTGRKEEYFYPFQSLNQLRMDGYRHFDSITWPIEFSNININRNKFDFLTLAESAQISFEKYLSSLFSFSRTHNISHHAAHAESAFFSSTFDNAHVLVIDGAGEEQSITLFYADRSSDYGIRQVAHNLTSEFSYGHLYGFFTSYLGYSKGTSNNHCGKIMGLSSYGQPKYVEILKDIYKPADGVFPSNHLSTFEFLESKFGPAFDLSNGFTQLQADIAASIQSFLEQDLIRLLISLKDSLPDLPESSNLCLAGGVAMNSVANGKLLLSGLYKDLFVQPASTDAGIPYGAAHFGARMSQPNLPSSTWSRANYGFNCSDSFDEVQALLNRYQLSLDCELLKNPSQAVSELLNEQNIVAVCIGSQEVGERALGYRSILSLPTIKMRDQVNKRVKFRESWRPFAPMILDEYMKSMFDINRAEPFMTVVYPVSRFFDDVAGIVHVDSTARLQTISEKDNPFIASVLKDLESNYSRPPVIINTSFNVNGQSMVRTSYDALMTFMSSNIDYLLVNDILVKKPIPSPDLFRRDTLSPLDRILEPYLRDKLVVRLNYFANRHSQSSEMLSKVLSTCSLSLPVSNALIDLEIFSNYFSDKQKWHQETIVARQFGRIASINHVSESQPLVSTDSINIVISDNCIFPKKVGHSMTSFSPPISLNDHPEMLDLMGSLRPSDIIIDEQLHPVRKQDWDQIFAC